MTIFDLWLSRKNGPTAETYVGNKDRLFYDSADGLLRVSDGSTPGGRIVGNLAITKISNTEPINSFPGELWWNPDTNKLSTFYQGSFRETINIASETSLGGIRLGPGVTTNEQGQIIIDSSGLEFSFGDFSAIDNKIQTINTNQDAIILSNGTGAVRIVGEFFVHPTNGENSDYSDEPYLFGVSSDGQVKIFVPDTDPIEGAVEIIGSSSGESISPAVSGVMLHITGNKDSFSSIYVDGIGGNSALVGRRYNGDSVNPLAVLNGETILRLVASGYSTTGFPSAGPGAIQIDALENFIGTSTGAEIKFLTAPIGENTRVTVARINNQEGIALKKITLEKETSGKITIIPEDSTGTNTITFPASTGAVITTNATNTVTNVIAGSLSVDPSVISRSTASVQTFTITGLTTNHKIVITSGTSFGYGVFISAAWVSAANTISIEFQNFLGNNDVDLPAKNIQYFAWI
jgi:hypothetical protein